MNISRIGIDLAKNVFQLRGVDHSGKTAWKCRLKRDRCVLGLLVLGVMMPLLASFGLRRS